ATGQPRYDGVRALAERIRAESAAERVRVWRMSSGNPDPSAESGIPASPTFARADLAGALSQVAEAVAAEGSLQREELVVVVSPWSNGSLDLHGSATPEAVPPPEAWSAVHGRVRLLVTPPMPAVSNVQVVAAQPRRSVVIPGAAGRA